MFGTTSGHGEVYDARLLERLECTYCWRRYQDRMREVGVAQFYREQLAKPRYK